MRTGAAPVNPLAWLAPPPPTTQVRPAVPVRACNSDGTLVSLARGVEGDGRSLSTRFRDLLLQPGYPWISPTLPGNFAAQWGEAIAAIDALDQRDEAPKLNRATFDFAVALLMHQGQGPLLLRMALLSQTFDYELRVADSANAAQVLASIGTAWPKEAGVSLMMSPRLPPQSMQALQAFLQCPSRLILTVWSTPEIVEGSTASVLRQVLQPRKLDALCLQINGASTNVLQALKGVEALAITIDESVPPPSGSSALPGDTPFECHAAVVELVRQTGAKVLKVPQLPYDGALCLAVLKCRSEWDTVGLNLTEASEVEGWLKKGPLRIGQFELLHWSDPDDEQLRDVLVMAKRNGVHTLVFHGFLDIDSLKKELNGLMRGSDRPHLFGRIQACFIQDVFVDDDDDDDGAMAAHPVEEALNRVAAMLNDPSATEVFEHPGVMAWTHMPSQRSFRGGSEALVIDSAVIGKIDGVNALKRAIPVADHIAKLQRSVDERRVSDLNELGVLLRDDTTFERFAVFLLEVSRGSSAIVWGRFFSLLDAKLEAVLRAPIPHDWRVAVVASCVRAEPALGLSVCQALLRQGWPMQTPTAKQWEAWGKTYAKTWVSKSVDEKVMLTAPAVHPDPNAPADTPALAAAADNQNTPHAPKAGVPADKPADVASATPMQVLAPARIRPVDLVEPSTLQGLNALNARMQGLYNFHRDQRNADVVDAIQLIGDVLARGTFNPANVKRGSVASAIVAILLDIGQVKLLQHFIDHTPPPIEWLFWISSSQRAFEMGHLQSWPKDEQCVCSVSMLADIAGDAAKQLAQFAGKVAGNQLMLDIAVIPHGNAEEQETIIRAHPGMRLGFSGGQGPLAADALTVFGKLLKSLGSPALSGVSFTNLDVEDEGFTEVVTGFVGRANQLSIAGCARGFTKRVLECRQWPQLRFSPEPACFEALNEGRVSAQWLTISPSWRSLDGNLLKTLIHNCRDTTGLEFVERPVSLLHLAQSVEKNRKLRHLRGGVFLENPKAAAETFKILRRNQSILFFDLIDMTPPTAYSKLSASQIRTLLAIPAHNRLRHPALSADGATRGLGWSKDSGLSDPFQMIVGNLDDPTLSSLSRVNKATYYASRQPWENEIDRMAELVVGQVDDAFKSMLQRQLNGLEPTLPELPVERDIRALPARTPFDKALVMQSMGVPDHAIGEVLGRALQTLNEKALRPVNGTPDPAAVQAHEAATQDCLKAMVWVGHFPASVWLKEVMGIDVDPAVALPALKNLSHAT